MLRFQRLGRIAWGRVPGLINFERDSSLQRPSVDAG